MPRAPELKGRRAAPAAPEVEDVVHGPEGGGDDLSDNQNVNASQDAGRLDFEHLQEKWRDEHQRYGAHQGCKKIQRRNFVDDRIAIRGGALPVKGLRQTRGEVVTVRRPWRTGPGRLSAAQ